MSLTIDVARRVLEASKQRAHELRSPVSIAIVDAGGHLVLVERMMAPIWMGNHSDQYCQGYYSRNVQPVHGRGSSMGFADPRLCFKHGRDERWKNLLWPPVAGRFV